MRRWTSVSSGEGGVTTALPGLGTLFAATEAAPLPSEGPSEIQRGAKRVTADTSVPSTALLAGADRDGSNYTARHLLVLEGLEAVRKRPGMYIGSTDSRGLMHCLWEIIDNSVDEALGSYGDHIEVILHDDASVEVRDNGRGIPVDVEPKTGLSGVEVVMTKLHMRRQVRRWLVRRLRRSARRRCLGGERTVRPARRRGRPRWAHPCDQLPPRRPRRVRR